jgi:hypothetical protein
MTRTVTVSDSRYDVQVDWPSVVPLGDTLSVSADGGFDDRWIDAFKVVLSEHARKAGGQRWRRIDYQQAGDEDSKLTLFVRQIQPDAGAFEIRRTVDGLVDAANTVAQVGTHVYELARELRQTDPEGERESVPPPTFDPLADELDATAA